MRPSALLFLLAGILLNHGDSLAGELSGVVTPSARVRSVALLDRDAKKTFSASFDPASGRFVAENLPAGTYDVILTTDLGVIAGVNLRLDGSTEQRSVTISPGAVDRTDLGDLVAWLDQKRPDAQDAPPLAAVVLKTSPAPFAVTEVLLRAGAGEVKIELTRDELTNAAAALAATVFYFEHRADFARPARVVVNLVGGKVDNIFILPASSELAAADRAWLLKWVDNVKAFENKRRVLFIRGDDASAKLLVELIRDQPTTLAAPEPAVFWRVEIWTFRKLHGGWEKTGYKVQERENLSAREFRKLSRVFEAALGGFVVPAVGRAIVPDYKLPDKLDSATGHVAE